MVEKIAVIGAGIMGSGIVQVFAQAGFSVNMRDVAQQYVEDGLGKIKTSLQKFVEKGKLSREDADRTLGRIRTTLDLVEAVRDVDFVVEAVPENMDLKKQVFRDMDKNAPEHAILTSNTSTLSITEMASVTSRPGKVLGMHFFNPPQLMRLVEIVRGRSTFDEAVAVAKELTLKAGKTPVVTKDSPGFIANRIWLPMINEAIYALHEGLGTAEDIDTVMKLGFNHPMGPLELADLVGLDTVLYANESIRREFNDPKYRSCILLKQMVRAGMLGRKTGKGFYDYTAKK